MKFFRKIKVIFYIAVSVFAIFAILVVCQHVKQLKEQQQVKRIQDLIDQERSGSLFFQTDEITQHPNINIDKIIQDGINNAIITPVFSDISMINSSTFTASLNGESKTYHLIGVSDDGNTESVKGILERLESIAITYDVRKEKDGVLQIYLWSGSTDNLNNMVNIQIVKQKICGTSYKNNSGLSETPNVTYSNSFIAASKQQ